MMYIHLNHPCKEVDVWEPANEEEESIARGQGYISLDDLRKLKAERDEYKLLYANAVTESLPF